MWLFLLLLSFCALVVHMLRAPSDFRPLWPKIPSPEKTTALTSCDTTEDCMPEHVCYQGECIPKLRRSGECNPLTGTWVLTQSEGRRFVKCVCRDPQVVTQKYEGGNCDSDVFCGKHGRLASLENLNLCVCDPGYHPTPKCTRMTALEKKTQPGPCREDEVDYYEDMFGTRYLKRVHNLGPLNCLKRPCSFDALTNKPLKHTRIDKDEGCICDPRWGNFGVRLDHEDYVNFRGYNACVNVFRDEPEEPIDDVKLYAYFYLKNRTPVAFIQFKNLPKEALKPIFRESDSIQIEEEWPYDFMQNVLHREHFVSRTRECWKDPFFERWSVCEEYKYVDAPMAPCWSITEHATGPPYPNGIGGNWYINHYINEYAILYKFLACKFDEQDFSVSKTYRGRIVLNPHHLGMEGDSQRSNGLVLNWEMGRWTMDLAEPFNFHVYKNSGPNLNDAVTKRISERSTTYTDVNPRQSV